MNVHHKGNVCSLTMLVLTVRVLTYHPFVMFLTNIKEVLHWVKNISFYFENHQRQQLKLPEVQERHLDH